MAKGREAGRKRPVAELRPEARRREFPSTRWHRDDWAKDASVEGFE